MEIDGKTYLSREEFFKKEGMPRFEVKPLDVILAKATRIIIHSFNSIDNCLLWLDRKSDATEDCCLRMGELLMFGDSY